MKDSRGGESEMSQGQVLAFISKNGNLRLVANLATALTQQLFNTCNTYRLPLRQPDAGFCVASDNVKQLH